MFASGSWMSPKKVVTSPSNQCNHKEVFQRDDPNDDCFHRVLLEVVANAHIKSAHDKKWNYNSGEDQVADNCWLIKAGKPIRRPAKTCVFLYEDSAKTFFDSREAAHKARSR
jgi:hypothetical protein